MSYVLKTNYANRENYGNHRNTSDIKYFVIHFTANNGDSDESNANYFKNKLKKPASAHYFVDDDSITQSVPDNFIAYSVGGEKYSNCGSTGGGTFYGKCTNANSLSFELCDTKNDNVIYPTLQTINNALDFVKSKMVQYGVDKAHVIRHFDVNGKPCPGYWCGTPEKDRLWKTEFWEKLCGWATYDYKWYWLDKNGNIAKNTWIRSNGKWYHLSYTGAMDTSMWIKNSDGTWSYVDSSGAAVTGWQKLSWGGAESWYYFDENGTMQTSKWISDNYYVTSSGAMATNCYVKSSSKNLYYWVGDDGAWQPEWNTSSPNLTKYKVMS